MLYCEFINFPIGIKKSSKSIFIATVIDTVMEISLTKQMLN